MATAFVTPSSAGHDPAVGSRRARCVVWRAGTQRRDRPEAINLESAGLADLRLEHHLKAPQPFGGLTAVADEHDRRPGPRPSPTLKPRAMRSSHLPPSVNRARNHGPTHRALGQSAPASHAFVCGRLSRLASTRVERPTPASGDARRTRSGGARRTAGSGCRDRRARAPPGRGSCAARCRWGRRSRSSPARAICRRPSSRSGRTSPCHSPPRRRPDQRGAPFGALGRRRRCTRRRVCPVAAAS
jgi:hypothetical protein